MKIATFFFLVLLRITTVTGQGLKADLGTDVKTNSSFSVQYIRSAMVKISYGNSSILVDPILADKGSEPAILYSNEVKNPTIELPFSKELVLKNVDAVLLTHYHPDHFDSEAERILPKDLVIFCQPGDVKKLQDKGFKNVKAIGNFLHWKGITVTRFRASHFKGANGELPFGESSSYFLSAGKESIFITGDAILDDRLKNSLRNTNPKLIIANTGECQFTKSNPVLAPGVTMTLTAHELKDITRMLPDSKIIAVHMDGINHCSLTKAELRTFVQDNHLKKWISVPEEGTTLAFKHLIRL